MTIVIFLLFGNSWILLMTFILLRFICKVSISNMICLTNYSIYHNLQWDLQQYDMLYFMILMDLVTIATYHEIIITLKWYGFVHLLTSHIDLWIQPLCVSSMIHGSFVIIFQNRSLCAHASTAIYLYAIMWWKFAYNFRFQHTNGQSLLTNDLISVYTCKS